MQLDALTAALSPRQRRLWEDLPGCDAPDKPHLHPHRLRYRHQSWPVGKGGGGGAEKCLDLWHQWEFISEKETLLCPEFRWCSLVMFQKPVGFDCSGRGTSVWPLTQSTCPLSRSFRCCTTLKTTTSLWRSASWYLLSPDLLYSRLRLPGTSKMTLCWLILLPPAWPLVVWRLWRHLEEDPWQRLSG